ncbi:MAG: NAD-dependent epimerase/dehydratase family protein [Verrucomicrobiae bacterium]
MAKAVVTGAAGFVGTNMLPKLLGSGFDVIGVDSLTRRGTEINLRMLESKYPKLDLRKREIEDMASVIYQERPDIVFHFAAQVAVTSSVESPSRDFKINAEGSFLIARAAAEVGAQIIYTSTNKVYGENVNFVEIIEKETRYDFGGELGGRGLPETFPIDCAHHTPYGVSKLVGELYVREFGGVANRCSCMYGPNQFGIVDQGWISHIATNKILGRPTVIYGDGKQVRDVLHIDDVTRLFLKQAEGLLGSGRKSLAGEVFNVGGGPDKTISLVELCNLWGIEATHGGWRPADQRVFYCDISKARDLLGWEPTVEIAGGLDDLYRWTASTLAENRP